MFQAERIIGLIKERLVKAAELLRVNNFSKLLPLVVENINHCKTRPFNFKESPSSVNNEAFDPYIRALRANAAKKGPIKKPLREKPLKEGNNVWLDLKAKSFSKGK